MKLFILAIMTMITVMPANAESIEGKIQLPYSESAFSTDTIKLEFGNIVKATTEWRAGDFFGKQTVFAGARVRNTGNQPMFFHYYVAFFDKNNKLIGASSQGSFGDKGLEPGKETQLGSCLIHLPPDRYKDIASYQAVIYETDKPPKKK
jgi:hypothetical protein